MSESDHNSLPVPSSLKDEQMQLLNNNIENKKDVSAESLIELVDDTFPSPNVPETSPKSESLPTISNNDEDELSDEERMLLYEKAVHFRKLGNLNPALLCFLGCLQGLQPSSKSKFTMLPQCLTHVAELYAQSEEYQRAVEFMQAAKLYYEIAIIEAGIVVDEYKKETDSGYRPLDLDPCLDEAKRANEYEKLSYSCLEHKKFQLALDYCGKATKLRQQVYGDDHPITGKSLDLFTLIYAEMGKCQYGEALQKYGDLTKVIEEEEKENKAEQTKMTEEKETGQVSEPIDEEVVTATDVSTLEFANNPAFEIGESTEIIDVAAEKMKENPNVDRTMKKTSSAKKVTFQDTEKTNEGGVKLITPCQFLIIFILSAFVSIFITGIWCYTSESEACPSRHYLYTTLKYWYYFYLVPPATDDKFY